MNPSQCQLVPLPRRSVEPGACIPSTRRRTQCSATCPSRHWFEHTFASGTKGIGYQNPPPKPPPNKNPPKKIKKPPQEGKTPPPPPRPPLFQPHCWPSTCKPGTIPSLFLVNERAAKAYCREPHPFGTHSAKQTYTNSEPTGTRLSTVMRFPYPNNHRYECRLLTTNKWATPLHSLANLLKRTAGRFPSSRATRLRKSRTDFQPQEEQGQSQKSQFRWSARNKPIASAFDPETPFRFQATKKKLSGSLDKLIPCVQSFDSWLGDFAACGGDIGRELYWGPKSAFSECCGACFGASPDNGVTSVARIDAGEATKCVLYTSLGGPSRVSAGEPQSTSQTKTPYVL